MLSAWWHLVARISAVQLVLGKEGSVVLWINKQNIGITKLATQNI